MVKKLWNKSLKNDDEGNKCDLNKNMRQFKKKVLEKVETLKNDLCFKILVKITKSFELLRIESTNQKNYWILFDLKEILKYLKDSKTFKLWLIC